FSDLPIELEAQSHDIADLPFIVSWVLQPIILGVVQPISVEEVVAFVKVCQKNHIKILPRGGATSGYGGALPTRPSVVIDFRRMNIIEKIDSKKNKVIVGAGIVWKTLEENLRKVGFALPTYPSSAPSATVGGWIAQGGYGIGAASAGDIGQLVVDLEVVLPSGEIIPINEQASTSDSDIQQMFIGTYGSLGLITKAILHIEPTFEVYPVLVEFETAKQALNAMIDFGEIDLYHLHFVDQKFNDLKRKVDPNHSEEKFSIMIAFKGPPHNQLKSEYTRILELHQGKELDEHAATHAWDERFYSMRIKRLGPALTPSEILIPLSKINATYDDLLKRYGEKGMALEGTLVQGKQVVILTYFIANEQKKIPFLFSWGASQEIVDVGLKHGGKPYSSGLWLASYQEKIYGEKRLNALKQMKRKVDSNKIMNPGKLLNIRTKTNFTFSLIILISSMGFFAVLPFLTYLLGFHQITQYYVGIFWNTLTNLLSSNGYLQTFVPTIQNIQNYLSSLPPSGLPEGMTLGLILGGFVGVAAVIGLNLIPFSLLMKIGKPFLTLGGRIFQGKEVE
ncbi:MAG: FAD-binding oxidoreductase, partial [Candidatus Ranarchaeia archaeon]